MTKTKGRRLQAGSGCKHEVWVHTLISDYKSEGTRVATMK